MSLLCCEQTGLSGSADVNGVRVAVNACCGVGVLGEYWDCREGRRSCALPASLSFLSSWEARLMLATCPGLGASRLSGRGISWELWRRQERKPGWLLSARGSGRGLLRDAQGCSLREPDCRWSRSRRGQSSETWKTYSLAEEVGSGKLPISGTGEHRADRSLRVGEPCVVGTATGGVEVSLEALWRSSRLPLLSQVHQSGRGTFIPEIF